MILDLKTGEKFADQISSGGDMKALGDGCFRIVPDNLETNMDILYLTKSGNLITRAISVMIRIVRFLWKNFTVLLLRNMEAIW